MAIMPMTQSVTISRSDEDSWGNPINAKTFPLKCRFEEGVKLTRKTSASQTGTNAISSEEVVSTAQIYFDKNADVILTDKITFTDESGVAQTYLPININRIRGLNGKTILTKVEV